MGKAAGTGSDSVKAVAPEDIVKMLKDGGDQELSEDMCTYVSALAVMALKMKNFDPVAWKDQVGMIEPFSTLIEGVRIKLQEASKPAEEEEDEEGVDLYKGNFSLAYGTLTLLRDARMRLK